MFANIHKMCGITQANKKNCTIFPFSLSSHSLELESEPEVEA